MKFCSPFNFCPCIYASGPGQSSFEVNKLVEKNKNPLPLFINELIIMVNAMVALYNCEFDGFYDVDHKNCDICL